MKVFGVMVVRDEADRYLRESVGSLCQVLDALLVYDDGSTDRTPEVAQEAGAYVVNRPGAVPALMDNESKCREGAWRCLVRLGVDLGDWVISLDADEFLVTNYPDRRVALLHELEQADEAAAFAVSLRVHEIFGWEDDQPMVRVDGFWGKAVGLRVMRWGLSTRFPDEPASIPGKNHRIHAADRISIAHLGYASEADRKVRYDRCDDPARAKSILRKPKLTEWVGELPVGPGV